jgi:hypothetical protein
MVIARDLSLNLRRLGAESRFARTARGLFTLREFVGKAAVYVPEPRSRAGWRWTTEQLRARSVRRRDLLISPESQEAARTQCWRGPAALRLDVRSSRPCRPSRSAQREARLNRELAKLSAEREDKLRHCAGIRSLNDRTRESTEPYGVTQKANRLEPAEAAAIAAVFDRGTPPPSSPGVFLPPLRCSPGHLVRAHRRPSRPSQPRTPGARKVTPSPVADWSPTILVEFVPGPDIDREAIAVFVMRAFDPASAPDRLPYRAP